MVLISISPLPGATWSMFRGFFDEWELTCLHLGDDQPYKSNHQFLSRSRCVLLLTPALCFAHLELIQIPRQRSTKDFITSPKSSIRLDKLLTMYLYAQEWSGNQGFLFFSNKLDCKTSLLAAGPSHSPAAIHRSAAFSGSSTFSGGFGGRSSTEGTGA